MWGSAKAPTTTNDRRERSDEEMFRAYTSIWQNIAREDSNVSNRIGWANTLTAGQFAAISFLVTHAIAAGSSPEVPAAIAATICAMSLLGMYFCYRTHLGVDAAHTQMEMLRRCYASNEPRFNSMLLPRPFGDGNNRAGRKSSHVYPIALLTFWSLIFVISLGGTIWSLARVAMTQEIVERQHDDTVKQQATEKAAQDKTQRDLADAQAKVADLQHRLTAAEQQSVATPIHAARPVPRSVHWRARRT